jgi:hypothetical protein
MSEQPQQALPPQEFARPGTSVPEGLVRAFAVCSERLVRERFLAGQPRPTVDEYAASFQQVIEMWKEGAV